MSDEYVAYMLARIRITVPDRPGMLGAVASAIGATVADVDLVDVLATEHGRAIDDIRVRVRDDAHLARVLDALTRLPGVQVQGVRSPVSPLSGHGDLELIRTVMCTPTPQVLVDQAAVSLEMTWAALTSPDAPARSSVIAASGHGPDLGSVVDHPVRLGPVPAGAWPATARQASARQAGAMPTGEASVLMVPLGDEGGPTLLLGREGTVFHASEVHRFGELGRVLGRVLDRVMLPV